MTPLPPAQSLSLGPLPGSALHWPRPNSPQRSLTPTGWVKAGDRPGAFSAVFCWPHPAAGTLESNGPCQHICGDQGCSFTSLPNTLTPGEPPGVAGSPQHPMHNLPSILFVHSHVAGAAIPPLLKGYTPLPQPLGRGGGGLFFLPWAVPLPLMSPRKHWHLTILLVRSLGQTTGPWFPPH